MRFLFITPRFHTNLYFPVKALKESGHEISILTLYKGKLEDYDDVVVPKEFGFSPLFDLINRLFNRKKIGYLKNNFELRYGFPPVFRLWREMRKTRPEVVFIKNIDSIFSMLAAFYAKLLGARIVFMLQIEKYRKKKKSRSVDFAGKIFNAKVITPLLGEKEYQNNNENLVYIPFVVEPLEKREEYFRAGRVNILSVGKFVRRKNHLLVLGVIEMLAKSYPLHLTIIGEKADDEYVREVEAFVLNHGLKETVTLRYDMSWKEVLGEYEHHDVFVLASSDEPAAYSPLEAMSRGLAIITSSANGAKRYIEESVNGFVFEDKNALDLKEKLEILIKDSEKVKEFGKSSLAVTQKEYDPSLFARQIELL